METGIRGITAEPLAEEDRQAFYALAGDERVARYMRFETAREESEAAAVFQEYRKRDACFALKEGETLAGILSLQQEGNDGRYDVSLFWSPAYWSRGYSTQLIGALEEYARKELGAKALLGHIVTANTASWRCAEKNGYTLTDTLYFPDCPEGLRVYEKKL